MRASISIEGGRNGAGSDRRDDRSAVQVLTEANVKLDEVVARITAEQAPAEETADERPAPAATDGAPQLERDSYAQSVSARERLFGASTTSKAPTGDREHQQRQREQQTSSTDRHTEVER